MDINSLLGKLQTPEQMEEVANKLAQWGRPPVGLPGEQGQPQPQAQPAMSPMALPPQAPQAPDLGSLLMGG
jgi:hypothetical protein